MAGNDSAGATRPDVVYQRLALPDGRYATVYSDGLAELQDRAGGTSEFEHVPLHHEAGRATAALPPRSELVADLAQGRPEPYASDDLLVAYSDNVAIPARVSLSTRPDAGRPARYTGDARLDGVLAGLGVSGTEPVAPDAGADTRADGAPLNLSRVYRLHVPAATAGHALAVLRQDPAIAYASPDWRVTSLNTGGTPLSDTPAPAARAAVQAATARGTVTGGQQPSAALPSNYGLTSGLQSLLGSTGVDAASAYSQIGQRFGQLPGQGEIITNVSLGTLTDASAAADSTNPCYQWAAAYGPTTVVQHGQRYLDWPGMPLIPTYTAGADGTLDPVGQVCGADDPTLTEVGLDFSMMAPLPHDLQRPENPGSGVTDLLGIAPGAQYRLVLPSVSGPATADMAAAFLAAAQQKPRPSVITASLGFGYDSYGFSGRYMEEDPVIASVIATIVHQYGIVVTVSAGDGLRTYTNAAVPPSGGSTATELAGHGQQPTDLNDVAMSTAPSFVADTGSIDVGATTLDDIASTGGGAGPASVTPYPETRYNGSRGFASGRGSRVEISAPGDNVIALAHAAGRPATAVSVAYQGGTSASTPEVAAAAAVVLQVARLTHAQGMSDPLEVRDLLVGTASPVAQPAQTDLDLHVGPQVDVGRAVETLLRRAGEPAAPSLPRIAVVARHPLDGFDTIFNNETDPAAIPLDHAHVNDWIVLAPDWQGLPAHGVSYSLTVGEKQLAATANARLQPSAILAAAGLPLAATTSRSVTLTYAASSGGRALASRSVTLTFGPSDGLATYGLAPAAPAVARGATIAVHYDLRDLVSAPDPVLVVSQPGRVDPASSGYFRPAYTVPLTAAVGTVEVPVTALPGAGIYGIGIQPAGAGRAAVTYTHWAFVRVAPTGDARPPAPLLAPAGQPGASGHDVAVDYDQGLAVTWDVRDVPGADGAIVEVSAAGPTSTGNQNPFNNPNGSRIDANGVDTGSVYHGTVHGTQGTVTLPQSVLQLDTAMNHVVRVLATHNGRTTGEGSEVSMVTRDGVVPSSGGTVYSGFGVAAGGHAGFVTSNGAAGGTVDVFDQGTNKVTRTVASSASTYQTPGSLGAGAGLFAGDTGLYERIDPDGSRSYHVVAPLSKGTDAGAWTPPAADVTPGGGTGPLPAPNQRTDTSSFLYGKNGPTGAYRVFTSNVAAGTFGPPIDVEPELSGYQYPFVTAFGADNSTGTAVLGASDFFTYAGPNRFVTVAADGSVSSFPGVTAGSQHGLAIDSTTHTMLAATDDGALGLYDVGTGAGTRFTLPGGGYQHPVADEAHHLFVMQEVVSPGTSAGNPDNNATSAIVVVDETGKLVSRVSGFYWYNVSLPINGSFVQVDPATRTGYTPGPHGSQLSVFHY
ncbi:hypothetical protein [Actinacidiphila acididurans]|uniref:Peptidase S8/S53 domain-containing protein n=1 Tax=Actinacidiphila acididurans TaxID=2784346 RepID=A0ABS2U0Y5_9ACTN|nr:hypothetical protein [Actinacidiphila acididurans]MBM9509250.1 hypothetical protein [Actinacidiphila acididurans]